MAVRATLRCSQQVRRCWLPSPIAKADLDVETRPSYIAYPPKLIRKRRQTLFGLKGTERLIGYDQRPKHRRTGQEGRLRQFTRPRNRLHINRRHTVFAFRQMAIERLEGRVCGSA